MFGVRRVIRLEDDPHAADLDGYGRIRTAMNTHRRSR